MRRARSARIIAIGATLSILALGLVAPASGANTRDLYFGSPETDVSSGGVAGSGGTATSSGTLVPLDTVTSGGAVAVRVLLRNDGNQTLNKISFIGGALADHALYNSNFPQPTYPSLDADLSFMEAYPLDGAPACDHPIDPGQIRCYVGTLASHAAAEYLIVIGTSASANGPQPFWLTASLNEGWSTTGTNADYFFAEGSVDVGAASCSDVANYFLANAPVGLSNTVISGCPQQTTINTAPVGGVGTFAHVKVGGQTPCEAVGLRCFGDDSAATVYGGNAVPGGVLWTMRWEPLTVKGKPKGVVHFLDAYYQGDSSAYKFISFGKQNQCKKASDIDCWTTITSTKTYFEVTFLTANNGSARGAY